MTSKKNESIEIDLIEYVHNNEVLWKTVDPNYKNQQIKKNLWDQFSREFSGNEAKSIWQKLRTGYRQAKNRSSGSEGGKIWKHLEKMSFLDEVFEQVEQDRVIPIRNSSN